MRPALIARGVWQQEIWARMLRGPVSSPQRLLTGRAASYAGKYMDSFHNMIRRAEAQGYRIERTPGVKGGEWSATYRVTRRPQ